MGSLAPQAACCEAKVVEESNITDEDLEPIPKFPRFTEQPIDTPNRNDELKNQRVGADLRFEVDY